MSNLNRTTLIGRVGRDPRVVTFSNGSKAADFSLATSHKWKDAQGQAKEETEWHNIVVYGNAAGVVEQYVKKGDLLFVEGRGRTRKYTDNGSMERSIHETIVIGYDGKIQLFPKKHEQPPTEQLEYGNTAEGSQKAEQTCLDCLPPCNNPNAAAPF
jgi:single-strand DNA-binding protein